MDAEIVVHYGHTCLSPYAHLPALGFLGLTNPYHSTSRLPTIYVFPRKPIDVDLCAKSLLEISALASTDSIRNVTVRLILDVSYYYQAGRRLLLSRVLCLLPSLNAQIVSHLVQIPYSGY